MVQYCLDRKTHQIPAKQPEDIEYSWTFCQKRIQSKWKL